MSKFKFISFATHAVIANQIENIGEPGLILTPPIKANKNNDGILTVSEIEIKPKFRYRNIISL